jgi:hypothetical protein
MRIELDGEDGVVVGSALLLTALIGFVCFSVGYMNGFDAAKQFVRDKKEKEFIEIVNLEERAKILHEELNKKQ